jgi:hypothetical protein
MLKKIRENLYLADENVTDAELKKEGITVLEYVAHDIAVTDKPGFIVFKIGLYSNVVNRPHIKDIACHIPKYMVQNGEKVAIISKTGKCRAAFVMARTICELESKSIYEIFTELQSKIEDFDIGKAYL